MKNIIIINFFFFLLLNVFHINAQNIEVKNKVLLKPKISLNPVDQEVAFTLDLKYGLFSHYVWGLKTVDLNDGSAKSIQEQINTFDVRQYARDCKNLEYSMLYLLPDMQ